MVRARVSSSSCLLLALGLALAPTGCKRKSEAAKVCDQSALAELAKQLEAAKPDARVAMVAEGLPAACGADLPGLTRHYLGAAVASTQERSELEFPPAKDPAVEASWGRLCADFDGVGDQLRAVPLSDYGAVVYRHCDLQRYDLMSREEAAALGTTGWMTWTTHEILLAGGTPAEIAKPISRAVMRLELLEFGLALIHTLPGQRLVELSTAGPVPTGVPIYASATQLVVLGQQLAALDEGRFRAPALRGHVVGPLFEALDEELEKVRAMAEARGEAPELRALLVLDARLPFTTVVDIMYTAGRAGFTDYAFIVQTEFPVKKAIELSAPRWGVELPPMLKVYIGAEGLRLSERDAEAQQLAKLDPGGSGPEAYDLTKLATLASAFHDRHSAGIAMVSADNDVRFEVLMSVYAALLGPRCDQSKPETCMFSELMIEAGAG